MQETMDEKDAKPDDEQESAEDNDGGKDGQHPDEGNEVAREVPAEVRE